MHIYRGRDEIGLPSVTHILHKTRPLAEVIRLNKAVEAKRKRENISKEMAEANRKIAADRGKAIHAIHENFWKTGGVYGGGDLQEEIWHLSIDPNINPYTGKPYTAGDFLLGFNDYLRDLRLTAKEVNFIASEIAVVSDKLMFGGRLDLLLEIDGKNHLFDLKTSNGYYHQYQQRMVYLLEKWRKPKKIDSKDENGKKIKVQEVFPPEADRDWSHVSNWVRDKYVQLAMYRMATMETTGIPVHRVNVLMLFPNNRYQLLPVPTKVFVGCELEALERINQFWDTEGDRWRLLMRERDEAGLSDDDAEDIEEY